PMDLKVIARFTGVRTEAIKDLNPELRRLCTPPNVSSYKVRIPRGTKKKFMKNLERTKGHEPYYINLYTVKSGDTVEKIAKSLGATIEAIVDMNELGAKAVIIAGRKILIPLEKSWEKVMQTARFKK
ncbi:MAG: LysM peptidoglycan-binding domain-containing protein, partial [Deltaproteobacteria bacterium]|nr:LysM peptidoglycan-binding domain-containing protein [Deltaproteobacteria bacterium]